MQVKNFVMIATTALAVFGWIRIMVVYPGTNFDGIGLFSPSKKTRAKTRRGMWLSFAILLPWLCVFVWWMSA